jgi:tryptophan halogenase
MSAPLTRIAVFGGGLVGLSAATALARALPQAAVELIATPADPAALADRLPGTLPALAAFNEAVGFPESDMLRRTGAMHRLATRFEGWSADGASWLFGYGAPGEAPGFIHHWLAASARGDATPLAEYHPGMTLAAVGRFAPEADYALTIDPAGYRAGLAALAQHRRVALTQGSIAAIEREGDGIAAVALADGRRITADLFVDATGPAAALLSALDPAFEDWGDLLPGDRLLIGEASPALVLYDTVTALDQGWCWRVPGRARTTLALTYAAATPDDEAARLFTDATGQPPAERLAFRPGRRRSWIGNVVGFGDAAVVVDPLHATNLQLAHGAILRLLHLLPDRRFVSPLRDEFNRRTATEAGRVRDFLAMHYRFSPVVLSLSKHGSSKRPSTSSGRTEIGGSESISPFWRRAAAASPPDSLGETLALLGARGRLPHFEEETFQPAEWQMAAIGLGLLPARTDALALAISAETRRAMLRSARERVAALVRAASPYPEALARLLGR